MRINEGLEKALSRLEEENSDYTISLLDVANAFEGAYKLINGCILADITDFQDGYRNISCKKVRYDAVKGKTIYRLAKDDKGESLLDIEISNLGDISWVIKSATPEEADEIIQEINQPNNKIMENLKMNADISFFSQNRELVLSEKPYVALKMGNFVEGDKPVIVYKEANQENEINKVSGGIQYIRVDQIEGYLRNIKIDERKIPVLAYAYLGRNYWQEAEYSKNIYERDLHLEYEESKIEKLKSEAHHNQVVETSLVIGASGLFVGGIGGGIAGSLLLSAGALGAILGAGIPIAVAALVYKNEMKKINFALNRDEKISEAKSNLYKSLREYANENIVSYEQEFTRRRTKKQKKPISLDKNLSASEIIRELKKTLTNDGSIEAKIYNLALAQIVNSYNTEPSNNAEKIKRDAEIYTDLIKLSEDIKEMDSQPFVNNCTNVLTMISQRVEQGDNNLTIQILSNLDKALQSVSFADHEHRDRVENMLHKTYLEALVNGAYQKNGLSVETIAEIPHSTRNSLLRRLSSFAKRMQGFDVDKTRFGNYLWSIVEANELSEIKLVKAANLVKEREMEFDLLGKVPTAKVKTK